MRGSSKPNGHSYCPDGDRATTEISHKTDLIARVCVCVCATHPTTASCRTLVMMALPRSRSIENNGHDIYRSVDGIHDAICRRVAHTLPSAAPAVWPKDNTKISPPLRGNNRQSGKSDRSDTVADGGEGNVHGRCLALRDYYPFWRENLEAARAGKLLPVDLSENPKVSALRKVKVVSCTIGLQIVLQWSARLFGVVASCN